MISNSHPGSSEDAIPAAPLRLLLVGATGVVGREVLRLALADNRVERVIAPTRRPLPAHLRLDNPVFNATTLAEDAPRWRADAVICTLGSTLKAAGTAAAFIAIDRDLPVRVAEAARESGALSFALNSSVGATPKGNFYLRTKAEAEQAIREVGYPSYTIVRPSIIDAERAERRSGERVGLILARAFRPVIPRRYRAVKSAAIAAALLAAVLAAKPGEHIIESEDIG